MPLSDQLVALAAAKTRIRAAIAAKGVAIPPGTTFADYADLILTISGSEPIVENVTHLGDLVTVDGEPVFVLLT